MPYQDQPLIKRRRLRLLERVYQYLPRIKRLLLWEAPPGPYQYLPLIKGHEIRLLEIKPLGYPTTSPFSLQAYDLSRLPPYEAISYTWGQPGLVSSVTCEGNCLPITNNCATMLKYLRLEAAQVRRVWIDQICINQNDIPERSDQVLLMTEIYSRAQQVIAWIGECDEQDKRLLTLLASMAFTDPVLRAVMGDALPPSERPPPEALDTVRYETSEVRPWFNEDGWAQVALDRLISRPYFGRRWIVQELTVARRVTLKCGEYSLDMQRLFDISSFRDKLLSRQRLMGRGLGRQVIHAGRVHVLILLHLRKGYMEHGTLDWDGFEYSFTMTRGFSVTDKRDKVYALRGICRNLKENTPLPDYSKSDVEIFVETAKASNISDKGRLTILGAHRSSRHGVDLPTWCPDYGQEVAPTCYDARKSERLCEKSRLSKRQPVVDGNHLIVRGKSVDSIAELSKDAGRLVVPGAPITSRFAIWRSWFSFMKLATPSYSGKEPMHLAFWSTMFNRTEEWTTTLPLLRDTIEEHWSTFIEDLHKLVVEHGPEEASYIWDRRNTSPRFESAMWGAMWYGNCARSCITAEKLFGLVPLQADKGDLVVYLEGAERLHLLRPQDGSGNVFKLVGPCFVHGLSNGERYPEQDSEMREIVIV